MTNTTRVYRVTGPPGAISVPHEPPTQKAPLPRQTVLKHASTMPFWSCHHVTMCHLRTFREKRSFYWRGMLVSLPRPYRPVQATTRPLLSVLQKHLHRQTRTTGYSTLKIAGMHATRYSTAYGKKGQSGRKGCVLKNRYWTVDEQGHMYSVQTRQYLIRTVL